MTVTVSAAVTFVSELSFVKSWTHAHGTWLNVSNDLTWSALHSWYAVTSQTIVLRHTLVYRTFYFPTYQTLRAWFGVVWDEFTPPKPVAWTNGVIIGFVTGVLAVALATVALIAFVRRKQSRSGGSTQWSASSGDAEASVASFDLWKECSSDCEMSGLDFTYPRPTSVLGARGEAKDAGVPVAVAQVGSGGLTCSPAARPDRLPSRARVLTRHMCPCSSGTRAIISVAIVKTLRWSCFNS